MTSRLTVAEARRVIVRAVASGALGAADATKPRAALSAELTTWDIAEVTDEVWRRAEQPLPVEPVRTLDALHLATALHLGDVVGGVAMLSVDDRLLESSRALGMPEALTRQRGARPAHAGAPRSR